MALRAGRWTSDTVSSTGTSHNFFVKSQVASTCWRMTKEIKIIAGDEFLCHISKGDKLSQQSSHSMSATASAWITCDTATSIAILR